MRICLSASFTQHTAAAPEANYVWYGEYPLPAPFRPLPFSLPSLPFFLASPRYLPPLPSLLPFTHPIDFGAF